MKESDIRAKMLSMKTEAQRIKFIRKQILGLTQAQLASVIAARTGQTLTRGAVGNWELGGGIDRIFESAICDVSGASLEWLCNGVGAEPMKLQGTQPIVEMLKMSANQVVEQDHLQKLKLMQPVGRTHGQFIPVYGAKLMSMEGKILLNNAPVSHVSASTVIEHDANAYAFYVPDNLMWPRAKAGDVGYVFPSRPAPDGAHVLIKLKPETDDGEEYGVFRLLVESRQKEFLVATHNPEREYVIPREQVIAVHHVRQVSDG